MKSKGCSDNCLLITAAIGAIQIIATVYDVLTFPVYYVCQRPWRRVANSKRVKATVTKLDETTISVKGNAKPSKFTLWLIRENVDTMEKLLKTVQEGYSDKKCLGTREIIKEEDEVQPNGRVFKKYDLGDYQWKSFKEVEQLAQCFGRGLRELGNEPRKNVVIFAETRAEWMIAAHGCFKHSIPVVTIYATLGDEAIAHGVNETEVSTIITTHDLLPKFKNILGKTPKVQTIIFIEDQIKSTNVTGYREDVKIISYSEVIEKGRKSDIGPVPPTPRDTAIIMYTSGSTGIPKGVILSHYNLISTLKAFGDAVPIRSNDVLMGFLPLAHVFELLVESMCFLAGVPIGYSTPLTMIDSSSKIKKGTKGDATILKPTCITSVPLIVDRICKGINEKASTGGAFKKALFEWAYEYKKRWERHGYKTPLLNMLIFNKISMLMGGKLRAMILGGAPLSPDNQTQIKTCLNCKLVVGYGLTETTSSATVMSVDDMSTGRVGAPSSTCEIRITNWEEANYRITNKPYPQGEIIVGGSIVAEGYYKLPAEKSADFCEEDGKRWFKTGDVGEVHPDGAIKIIDRKKDLVKLQAGEYVSLGKVEAELKTSPLVENICVYGDSHKQHTIALVMPNQQHLEKFVANMGLSGLSFEEMCVNETVAKNVAKELAEHGKKCKLERFEIPTVIKLVTDVWTPESGLVTAAFKLKRKEIQNKYQDDIKKMYM